MSTFSPAFDLVQTAALNEREELIRDVQTGLHSLPRTLKPWMFYDELGSQLFERITKLAEYYPTRTERVLLESHADAIVALRVPVRNRYVSSNSVQVQPRRHVCCWLPQRADELSSSTCLWMYRQMP